MHVDTEPHGHDVFLPCSNGPAGVTRSCWREGGAFEVQPYLQVSDRLAVDFLGPRQDEDLRPWTRDFRGFLEKMAARLRWGGGVTVCDWQN